MTSTVAFIFATICITFTLAQFTVMAIYTVLARGLFRSRRAGTREAALARAKTDPSMPGVSIIMPAYNEELMITFTTVSALAQSYPKVEVVVTNDGSTDNTVQVLVDHFGLEVYEESPPPGPIETEPVRAIYRSRTEPRIVLVDKEPSGAKADGSNAGINVASYPYVVIMDADEFMERDTIVRCMVEVMEDPDRRIGVGGTLLPSNDIVIDGPDIVERHVPRNYWVGNQLIEYLTAFMVARPGLARMGALPIISGGFGLYRRDAVLAVDGYRHGHLGEDMDICIRVQRHFADRGEPVEIVQVPESLCWTEFPDSRTVLRRQRLRWHRGLKEILDGHGTMIGRRRYGAVGSYGITSLYVFEWVGPILEAIGWVVMLALLVFGLANPGSVLIVFGTTQLFGMALTMLGIVIATRYLPVFTSKRDVGRLLVWALAFNWGYRQITLWWRIRSLLPGSTGWGEMTRSGFKTKTSTS